jgi:hypothetical protein
MTPELQRSLAVLAAEHRASRAPLSVETAVLAEFDSARRRRMWRRAGAAGVIAASLLTGALVTSGRRTPPPATTVASAPLAPVSPVETAPHQAAPVKATPAVTKRRPAAAPQNLTAAISPQPEPSQPFVAIPYTVPLAPGENATVLRVVLSASAMAAIGFPLPAIDPSVEAQADILVGEDGRARAVRLVASSNFH